MEPPKITENEEREKYIVFDGYRVSYSIKPEELRRHAAALEQMANFKEATGK